MSNIKNFLYEEENEPSLTDMEEYELYVLYSRLSENLKTKEEILDFFQPLIEEGGE